MLEKLIESTDTRKQTRRMRSFFATIGTAMSFLFVAGLVFSIFSTNLAMGSDSIDLSRIVAPAVLPDTAPQKPQNAAPDKTTKTSEASRLPTRAQNIQRLDEVPVRIPTKISTAPAKYRARPFEPYIVSDAGDSDGIAGPVSKGNGRQAGSNNSTGFNASKTPAVKPEKDRVIASTTSGPPPIVVKNPPPVSEGVVNGKAINLVVPVRSAAAASINLKGKVTVNVLISETGKVESASAASGPALLKNAAVAAARRSTFRPTTVSNQPVKVRGVIIYNFN